MTAFAGYWIVRQANVAPLWEWGAIPHVGLAASAGFGSLLGIRHALEPDHLAAVSTLITGERSSAKAAWLGACWGLGHTLTLFAAGAMLVVFRAEMPPFASQVFEFCVVLMLVGFGVRAIYQGARGRPAGPTHSHANRERQNPCKSAGGPSHGGRCSWARCTDWREVARSPRSSWPRSRRR